MRLCDGGNERVITFFWWRPRDDCSAPYAISAMGVSEGVFCSRICTGGLGKASKIPAHHLRPRPAPQLALPWPHSASATAGGGGHGKRELKPVRQGKATRHHRHNPSVSCHEPSPASTRPTGSPRAPHLFSLSRHATTAGCRHYRRNPQKADAVTPGCVIQYLQRSGARCRPLIQSITTASP